MNKLLKLYFTFFKIGLFTFGGGYAMLPLLEREVVEKHKWTSRDNIYDYYAIGQVTPGIIAINTATFIGYKLNKLKGIFAAVTGLLTPSFVIITLIANTLEKYRQIPVVEHAFNGIRLAVVALVLKSVYSIFKNVGFKYDKILIFILSFALIYIVKLSPATVVMALGVFSLFIRGVKC